MWSVKKLACSLRMTENYRELCEVALPIDAVVPNIVQLNTSTSDGVFPCCNGPCLCLTYISSWLQISGVT